MNDPRPGRSPNHPPSLRNSPSTPSDRYRDKDVLNELCNLACDRLEGFLDHFDLSLKRYGQRYVGPCPVHGGRSAGGVNLYADGYAARGNWQCHSNKCETFFSQSLVGFTRGVLSHDRYGWSKEGDRRVPFKTAVDEICRFLKVDFGDITIDPARAERRRFNKTIEILSPTGRPANELCTKETFLRHHDIPSKYYQTRGFSPSTLRKFEVGECTYRRSPNHGRIIVPVYDPKGDVIIGVLSRSPHPKCPRCKACHEDDSPCSNGGAFDWHTLRWKVFPDGFNDKHHLYNLWRSRPMIIKSKCVVIAEGAGDVWRLDEAGILNSVAMMGSKLSTIQDIMLEECSPAHVVIMTDDNEAGNTCADLIAKKWKRLAHVHRLKAVGCEEVSDMTTEDVRVKFRGLIESWMK